MPDLGERDVGISIHALLAESDKSPANFGPCIRYFYPRSPCGERLHSAGPWRAGCRDFYPRSPCGERLMGVSTTFPGLYFYPRSPCGERRAVLGLFCPPSVISIHALLAESDCWNSSSRLRRQYFYPRSPCGERLFLSLLVKLRT